jgi:hypothetical protein
LSRSARTGPGPHTRMHNESGLIFCVYEVESKGNGGDKAKKLDLSFKKAIGGSLKLKGVEFKAEDRGMHRPEL